MIRQLLRHPSRSPSPAFADTLDPLIFESRPALSPPANPSSGINMGECIPEMDSAGTLLRDRDTEKMLEFLQELNNLGVEKYIDLPQLVVVGDQSSGKSSVLQAITRLPFPVGDRLCTRFPTEVALHRSTGQESISVKIKLEATRNDINEELNGEDQVDDEQEEYNDTDDGYEDVDEDEELIEGQSFHVLQCRNYPFGSPEFAVEFERVLDEAKQYIFQNGGDSVNLSKATLHITVKGPDQIDLTIVDIPGLVSEGHPASRTARALVEHYINNPRSIILAVAHPTDPDTQEVFRIIGPIPQKENRVIGVITKCDRKQEGAENWILDTIKNERRSNNPHHLLQGWYGLRNRLPVEKLISDEERDRKEAQFFSQGVWKDLGLPTKLGINNLRTALTKMHNDHIKKSIPKFIPEIAEKVAGCEQKLAQLGNPRSTKNEQLGCMVQLASDFEKLSKDSLDGYYQNLPPRSSAKLRRIVQESLERFEETMKSEFEDFLPNFSGSLLKSLDESQWRHSILQSKLLSDVKNIIDENRGTEFKDEVNSNVMKVLWKGKTETWENHTYQLVEEISAHITKCLKIFIKATTPEEELQRKTLDWLSNLLPPAFKSAEAEAKKILSEESNGTMWTLVPRRSERVGKWYEGFPKGMARSLMEIMPMEQSHKTTGNLENLVKLWLAKNKDIDAVLNTYVRLIAYYEVAMYRYIDNIGLQVVERHLLGPQSPLKIFTPSYVVKMAEEEPELLKSIAGENEDKVAERAAITKEHLALKTALNRARTYGYYM